MQYRRPTGLPDPDAPSAEHSRRVAGYIENRIAEGGGSISFAQFMQHALYAPGLGYYSAGTTKFGAAGDFVTAPEVSGVFGRIVARQSAEVLAQVDDGDVLEFGAGSGKLAADVMLELERLGAAPRRYRILEVSPDLAERQKTRLARDIPQLVDRVEWLDRLPADHRGVVLANEVLDAMPFERFARTEDGCLQQRVAFEDGAFRMCTAPAPRLLADAVAHIEASLERRLEPGYVSEVSPAVHGWIRDVAAMLREGCLLLFDYGGSRAEMYADDRSGGWLRCHYRHRGHSDPFALVGIQDITSWVDFTGVAEAAVDSGLEISGYQPQSTFLAGGGLDLEMQAFGELSVDEQLALSDEIKTLTLPGEMGENIKCIGLATGPLAGPSAFRIGDRTHTL